MKYLIKFLVIMSFFCIFNVNVYAYDEEDIMTLNPEWIEYMKLSKDEKALYTAIPEQYIYKYIPKNITTLDNYNKNYFSLDGEDDIPIYFNLADLDGGRYVNSKNKNQGSLGLCWAFGAIGSLESNILYNGVIGIEEAIAKCDENNPDSTYCKYKEDSETNDYYVSNAIICENEGCADAQGNIAKKTIDNATFSERIIDYIRSKPTDSTAYNNSSTTYTLIEEKVNPYTSGSQIGSGGSFSSVSTLYSYGVTPTRALEGSIWEKYTIAHNTVSLYDVYGSVDNIYQVTNYYNFPSAPSDLTQKEAWIEELKTNIMTYGSVYVSTTAPQSSSSGSCYYYDSTNKINLINNTGSCGKTGGHAMQIIGWDDNYEFEYCKVTENRTYNTGTTSVSYYSSNSSSAGTNTQDGCENLDPITTSSYTATREGKWTSGKGAWILKNSWGTSTVYPYLSYQSSGLGVYGVREVSVSNYENSYNEKNSFITRTSLTEKVDGTSVTATQFKFDKTINKEYLTRLNFVVSTYNKEYKVYVSKDGENYTYVSEGYVDYPGMYTVDVDNFELGDNVFYIKIVGISASKANAFTVNECTVNNSCDETIELISETSEFYYNNTVNKFDIITRSRNLPSGTKLEYKIYNENNEDITYLFDLKEHYIINNSNRVTINASQKLDVGKYFIHTISEQDEHVYEFRIMDKTVINLEVPYPLFVDDGSVKIDSIISSTEDISNYVWVSSNTDVATVDDEGNLTILKNGITDISLTIDTLYGSISDSVTVYIYDKIFTVEDFLDMQSIENNTKLYYLMNDLDFENIDFSKYDLTKVFQGMFDGGNHTIKNIRKSNNSRNLGLFNQTLNATIMNLKILDSVFEGTGNSTVGAVVGYSTSSTISNIHNDSTITSSYASGGIVGESYNSTISECYNSGKITSIATNSYSYSGGIIGNSIQDKVSDSYNEGEIYSETQWNRTDSTIKAQSTAGGIMGENFISSIINSYNTGKVFATSPVSENYVYSNGLAYYDEIYTDETTIENSYYLYDEEQTVFYEGRDFVRYLDELKTELNYVNWNFDNKWFMKNGESTPSLRNFEVEAQSVEFNMFSSTLNINSTTDYSYEILPYSSSGELNIYSEDEALFEVTGNQIKTKDKIGSANLVFKIGEKEFKYPITVKPILSYKYDNSVTNKDVSVEVDMNYYNETVSDTSYLKIDFTVGEIKDELEFDYGSMNNSFGFKVSENKDIKLELYLCDYTCDLISEESFIIDNIDKEKPIINYIADNLNNTLQINVNDIGVSGLSNINEYKYAISNSNTLVPTIFHNYTSNTVMNNINMDKEYKYLWIKNISDNVGNKVSEEENIVYTIDLKDKYFDINYYNEDGSTLLKNEKIKEDDIVIINFKPNDYEDSNYNYVFDYWDGYKDGMVATSNINLYAVYKKIPKKLSSDNYKINNGYIYNIKLDNINSDYSVDLFKSNLKNYDSYSFDENSIKNIKTGLKYKNSFYEYRIVLAGDVTGDGKVKMNDVMKIANHLVNKNVLASEYLLAGDVTNDENVKMNDVMKIANALVNGGSL